MSIGEFYWKVFDVFSASCKLPLEELADALRENPDVDPRLQEILWGVLKGFDDLRGEMYWVLLKLDEEMLEKSGK